jgi:hypothetical protein
VFVCVFLWEARRGVLRLTSYYVQVRYCCLLGFCYLLQTVC